MKGKKAQEEMVGFVLIIVLLVVIGLIFLALSLRQKTAVELESKQVANLLDSMLQYTTDCAIYMPQYESLRDLIKSCYYEETCVDGVSSCQALHDVVENLLETAQPDVSSAERTIKAYEFNASYTAEQKGFFVKPAQGNLAYVSKGRCSGSSIGAQEFVPLDTGNIKVSLRFCY